MSLLRSQFPLVADCMCVFVLQAAASAGTVQAEAYCLRCV
mgnify:FL=1